VVSLAAWRLRRKVSHLLGHNREALASAPLTASTAALTQRIFFKHIVDHLDYFADIVGDDVDILLPAHIRHLRCQPLHPPDSRVTRPFLPFCLLCTVWSDLLQRGRHSTTNWPAPSRPQQRRLEFDQARPAIHFIREDTMERQVWISHQFDSLSQELVF
jgi:hypothetical protein